MLKILFRIYVGDLTSSLNILNLRQRSGILFFCLSFRWVTGKAVTKIFQSYYNIIF